MDQNTLNQSLIDTIRYNNGADAVSLIEKGADVNSWYIYGEALFFSCKFNNFKVTQYLVEHGADINANYGKALTETIVNKDLTTIKFLITNGAQFISNDYGDHHVFVAARLGFIDIIKFFIIDCEQDIDLVLGYQNSTEDILTWAEKYKNSCDLENNLQKNLSKEKNNNHIKIKI